MNLNQVKALMQRPRTARKGENGHLLIIGGSPDYVGGLALAGIAALRVGCDIVTIAAPEKTAWAVHQYSADVETKKLRGVVISQKHTSELLRMAESVDAVLLGIGMGEEETSKKFCIKFMRHVRRPLVLDGDAIQLLGLRDIRNTIITPSWDELIALLIQANKQFLIEKIRSTLVKETASILQSNLKYFLENNNILVIKAPSDMVISRNKIYINRTGNPGMAKKGTGDILSGMIGGLVAKVQDPFKSACAATYLNGYVADTLVKKKGFTFLASDILDDMKRMNKIK